MFNVSNFMPHGFCYLWRQDLLALHATSDALIFIAYMLIPIAIQKFIGKRTDIPNLLILRLFQLFIVFCGITHFLEVISIWFPIYFTTGLIKMATALISITTAVYASKVLKRLGDVKDFNLLAAEDEHELSMILDEIVDGYIIVAREGSIKHRKLSETFETIFGTIDLNSTLSSIKERFEDLVGDFENDNVYKVANRTINEYIKVNLITRKNDNIFLFKIVTKSKKLQDDHDQKEAMINLVLNNVPALISIVSKDLKYLLVNKEYEKKWERSMDQIVGHSLTEVLPGSLFDKIEPHVKMALEGKSVSFDTSYRDGDKEVSFNVSYLPYIIHGNVEGFFTMAIDNTEKSLQERALLEKNAQLEALTKDLEEFVFFISHDLQAPIRHILSFSTLLLKDLDVPEEKKQYVDIINSSCHRARELVEGILKVANLKKENFLETSLDKLFYTFINTVKMENPEIDFSFNIPAEKNVRCIPFQMSLVFENYVNNAIRVLQSSERNEKFIHINYVENLTERVVYIEDNGRGVAPEHESLIFGIFKSFTREKSTGVGLAIVERVAELHDARIGFFNNSFGGASFWIAIKK